MDSGKAANLARLAQLGFRVPSFYVVTSRSAVAEPPLSATQSGGSATALLDGEFFAVRSSAVGEDAAGASFAGIHDSFLFVPRAEIADAIEKVRASATSERALAYRREHGIPIDDRPMPVIVQQMIDSIASGVVFTANPTTQDTRELVISSLFGLGEGLVSQGFDADTFVVQKSDLSIAAEIAEKTEAIVRSQRVQVANPNERSLTDEQVRELAQVSIAIENAFGRPQDIEFAFDASGLWILQTRPITTVEEYGPAAGNRILWDNSNIVESFSGVTSPMTFSVIRRAYAIVYRLFAQVMGIPDAVVQQNKTVFENTLGLFRGQVFYNLLNWYAMVRLFPGYEQNKQFMESMMGVRESGGAAGTQPTETAGGLRARRSTLLPLAWRMFRNFSRIDKLTKEFEANFKLHYDRWSRIDFDALAPHELMRLYFEFEDRVLWSWRAPIINDFFVMIFYGTLKKLCTNWCGVGQAPLTNAASLQNDLLSGEGGIESAEPAKMLLRLAELARPQESLRDAIQRGDLQAARQHADFARELDRYMELYGFRGMNELKLEEPPLRDRPDVVLTYIRNYLMTDVKPQPDVRAEAEQRAFSKLSPLRKLVFRYVLNRARIGVRNRENMRFARTRIFGLVREVVRAMGRRLAAEGILDSADDVFYLGLEELWDYVKGTALTSNLRELTALRRKEFDEYRANPDIEERFETFGMAYHRNRFRSRPGGAAGSQPADGSLKGIACSPGIVTGAVKVLRSPDDDLRLNGEILVAERTDPGWVPLYPSISGLLIERGSILSHSAIVAREMGIPTIVGIRGLTQLVKSDDVVTMDGSTGVVELVKK